LVAVQVSDLKAVASHVGCMLLGLAREDLVAMRAAEVALQAGAAHAADEDVQLGLVVVAGRGTSSGRFLGGSK
jgi:hypothetical protein